MTPHRARHLTTIPDLADLNAECQHAPVVIAGPTIVYGKGELGQMAVGYLRAINRPSFHQIDADWLAALPRIPGPMLDSLVLVAVARWPYVPIEQALTDHGFTNVAPFLDVTPNHPEHPLANGWFADPLDLDKVQTVLDMFEDDVSRKHYVSFLAWRRLREEWTFESAPVDVEGPRYWPHEVASMLRGEQTFIDGGAYDGKTSEQFIGRFGGLAFPIEPPRDMRGGRWPSFALSDYDGSALFRAAYGYASRLTDDPSEAALIVPCWTLDRAMAFGGFNPTFIKIHLEGHELPALRGAVKTIETHRPILAVTTYHNSDGIDRIPTFLRDHCLDYRFLWRNSAYVGEGAVMFAIPRDRQ